MPDPLWLNASAGTPAYTANELRQAMALALMYDGRNMGGRKGVRPGGNQLQVSLTGSTITVQPGLACLDPALSTPQGPYWVTIPVAETHTLSAADATNPRKDIIICRVYDHDEDVSGLRLARTEYLVGTANPSPVEPSLPGSAIRLARIDVPATPGIAVVTDRRPWTVASGGILPVALAGDIAAGVEGRYRDRLDTNVLERDTGSVWETVADPAIFKPWNTYTPIWTAGGYPAGAAPSVGNGTLSGRWRQVGKTANVDITLSIGSTTSFGTSNSYHLFTLPVTAASFTDFVQIGKAMLYDVSINGPHSGSAHLFSTTQVSPGAWNGFVTGTNPFTFAPGDSVSMSITYEVP